MGCRVSGMCLFRVRHLYCHNAPCHPYPTPFLCSWIGICGYTLFVDQVASILTFLHFQSPLTHSTHSRSMPSLGVACAATTLFQRSRSSAMTIASGMPTPFMSCETTAANHSYNLHSLTSGVPQDSVCGPLPFVPYPRPTHQTHSLVNRL